MACSPFCHSALNSASAIATYCHCRSCLPPSISCSENLPSSLLPRSAQHARHGSTLLLGSSRPCIAVVTVHADGAVHELRSLQAVMDSMSDLSPQLEKNVKEERGTGNKMPGPFNRRPFNVKHSTHYSRMVA
ncbi:hypothetical protein LZ31DRAFT_369576 [Colletotrichum somersetense]|nr:hypothetical protein LZ31DRAFT_369576 [Colletotrichum somersetense]